MLLQPMIAALAFFPFEEMELAFEVVFEKSSLEKSNFNCWRKMNWKNFTYWHPTCRKLTKHIPPLPTVFQIAISNQSISAIVGFARTINDTEN